MEHHQANILVIDDEIDMQLFLKKFLVAEGHHVKTCSLATEALKLLEDSLPAKTSEDGYEKNSFDLILTDVNMPLMNGLAFVKAAKELKPEVPIVMITAFGTIESAVEAMKRGAHDYLTKPFKLADLRATVSRTLQFKRLEAQNSLMRNEAKKSYTAGDLIGNSPAMLSIFELIKRVSQVNSNVLILGESGTGKEVVARAIHNEGPRAKHPFIALNCASIPENLLESELFGHAKGSFTGALSQKRGLFEEAEGGTIFLDEIGDMNVNLQAKLLRVIQERKIRPVGHNSFRETDVRVIAATHRDLKLAIADGTFREDLYYRLSVVPIMIPSLRDRKEDIPLFASYFLKKYSTQIGSQAHSFSPAASEKLLDNYWEGNVRQLENAIERAVILCDDETVGLEHLAFLDAKPPESGKMPPALTPLPSNANLIKDDSLSLKTMEKRSLEIALQKAGGRKEKAAQLLGISRKTLYRKEKEYGL